MKTFDIFLGEWGWYRHLRGGRWERWYVRDPINGHCWLYGHHKPEGLAIELCDVKYY